MAGRKWWRVSEPYGKMAHSLGVGIEKHRSSRKKYTKREAQCLMTLCALLGFLIGLIL